MKIKLLRLLWLLIFVACEPNINQTSKADIPQNGDTTVLFNSATVQFKLDSLSKSYKGKMVTIKKSDYFKIRKFIFYRDTTTLREVSSTKLKEGDKVKIIGEYPVNNDRVKIKTNSKEGYIQYFDIAEFEYLFKRDSEYN